MSKPTRLVSSFSGVNPFFLDSLITSLSCRCPRISYLSLSPRTALPLPPFYLPPSLLVQQRKQQGHNGPSKTDFGPSNSSTPTNFFFSSFPLASYQKSSLCPLRLSPAMTTTQRGRHDEVGPPGPPASQPRRGWLDDVTKTPPVKRRNDTPTTRAPKRRQRWRRDCDDTTRTTRR